MVSGASGRVAEYWVCRPPFPAPIPQIGAGGCQGHWKVQDSETYLEAAGAKSLWEVALKVSRDVGGAKGLSCGSLSCPLVPSLELCFLTRLEVRDVHWAGECPQHFADHLERLGKISK